MLFNGIRLTIKCLQCTNSSRLNNVKTTVTRFQQYSDWYHRQPVRIVNEEEILQFAQEAEGPNEFIEKNDEKNDERKPMKARLKKRQIRKKLAVTPNDAKLKDDGSLNITELSETDKILTSLMMSVRSKKKRDKNSRIILEGHRLITDAIESGAIPEIIVFSRNPDVMKLPLPDKGVKLFKVPYRAIQTWSTLVTPPGTMGFFKLPDMETRPAAPDALPMTIVCDNVRDPGNMGSLLRAAAAVGCKKLITLKGCVDIWEPKVLKSAAGAHFRLPIFASKTWDDIPKLIDPLANVYVADNNILNEEKSTVDDPTAVANNEEVIDEVKIDENETSEMNAQLLEYAEDVELDEEEKPQKRKTSFQRKREVKIAKRLTSNIPVIPYYATDYTSNENVIVIGGETEGLSLEALDLVDKSGGIRINIPMTNGVDSLNTGMALDGHNKGYVIVRFYTSVNLGYWLREARSIGVFPAANGPAMQFFIRLGTRENLPTVPIDFPTCGNHKGLDLIFEDD